MAHTNRILFCLGALCGACGVALSAVAAHREGTLGTAANMLLFHAPALMVLAGLQFGRLQLAGTWILAVGLALFCGDIAARAFLGDRLFPMAAPAGGMLLIAGWAVVAASALFSRRGSA
ncbi:MAG: DUF423 domain-containing protein [Aliihoeflea sp.]|uniref:DUF423 domain-containing protein n=1 Tax=Aliihoeflea sp. TaxID=2608088 RepID=UPI00403473D7